LSSVVQNHAARLLIRVQIALAAQASGCEISGMLRPRAKSHTMEIGFLGSSEKEILKIAGLGKTDSLRSRECMSG
jgi:hypothetical protein